MCGSPVFQRFPGGEAYALQALSAKCRRDYPDWLMDDPEPEAPWEIDDEEGDSEFLGAAGTVEGFLLLRAAVPGAVAAICATCWRCATGCPGHRSK
eukprot:TRINITY_DN16503_c0_g1_i1.p2 TRINITY_DN16503_c0_g1~~TRINITY_DN16503_c0_g1_i1.p2  ORF type:complete len:104 (+),score=38.66 TRINITY_DN16503_c0_g1_i1:25-312(+)